MVVMTAMPERTATQRMEALKRANDVRSYRRVLKIRVKSDAGQAVAALLEPTSETESMKVFDLLIAMPKVGRVKVNKMLGMARVSPSKTVGGLTGRQRQELLAAVRALSPPLRRRS